MELLPVFLFPMILMFLLLAPGGMINSNIAVEKLNKMMMAFTILMMFLIIKTNMNKNYQLHNKDQLLFLMVGMVLSFLFCINNLIFFYFVFEFSVLPLMYLVSSLGYSLERIKSMMYMYMYTVFFSMPALFVFIKMSASGQIFSISNFLANLFSSSKNLSMGLMVVLTFMFLMKMPIWGFHFWLPKAHVEASVQGSMILASLILKMGVFGLIKALSTVEWGYTSYTTLNFFSSLAIIGSLFLSMACSRQMDNKMAVALSSIVHMGPCLVMCFFMYSVCMEAVFLVMVSHGFISPLMFLFIYKAYETFKSRSLLLSLGTLKENFVPQVLWFLICIFNMGLPMTMNFMGEMNFFFISLLGSLTTFLLFVVTILLNGIYNIFLFNFLTSSSSKDTFLSSLMNPKKMKTFSMLVIVTALYWAVDIEV